MPRVVLRCSLVLAGCMAAACSDETTIQAPQGLEAVIGAGDLGGAVLRDGAIVGVVPFTISLDVGGAAAGDGYTYRWTLPDGTISTEASQSVSFETPGDYLARVEVTRAASGATAEAHITIHALPAPNVVVTATPPDGSSPLETSLTCTNDAWSELGTLTYHWDLGDGGTSLRAALGHVYAHSGSYTATCTTTSPEGGQASGTVDLSVDPGSSPSVVVVSDVESGVAPLTVSFDPAVQGDDGALAFFWDFGDGETTMTEGPVSHTYDTAGRFVASLTVTDGTADVAHDSIIIDVEADGTPIVEAAALPATGTAPLSVQLVAEARDGNPPYRYVWDFGDETPTSGLATAGHTYAEAGSYTATVTATDRDGDSATAEVSVTAIPVDRIPTVFASANINAGVAPLEVTFHGVVVGGDGTTGEIVYQWDFDDPESGDANRSTETDPTHTFAAAGIYLVTLTVADADGDSATALVEIAVGEDDVPTALATASPSSGLAPLEVVLGALVAGGNPPYSYAWDTDGDGETDTVLPNPVVTYAAGTRTAEVTVTDIDGDAATADVSITVAANTSPAATVNASPLSGRAPLTVTFGCTSASGNAPRTFQWAFGDGQTSVLANTTHTYAQAGSYQATCTVVDGDGQSDSESVSIAVSADRVPTVVISAAPESGVAPLEVAFTALVAGGDGDPADFEVGWIFGDPASGADNTATGANADHAFAGPGVYLVAVFVTDEDGDEASDTQVITVGTDAQPIVSATGAPATGVEPLVVAFETQVAGGDPPFSFGWDFGDGQTGTGASPTHVYADAGDYDAVVTVTDGDGDTDTATVEIAVQPYLEPTVTAAALDVVSSTPIDGGLAPLTVQFSCLTTGSVAGVSWTLGDGTTASVTDPRHTYAAAGSYRATCRVEDVRGNVYSDHIDLVILADTIPTPQILATPNAGDAPLEVVFSNIGGGTNAPFGYDWTFGDGVGTATVANPSYTYGTPGTYQVVLAVTDGDGDVGMAAATVTVTRLNVPPHVVVTASDLCTRPDVGVQLDATQSWDCDDPDALAPEDCDNPLVPLSYEWVLERVPAGAVRGLLPGDRVGNPTLQPDADGEYRLRAYVSDGVHRVSHALPLVIASSSRPGAMSAVSGPITGQLEQPLESPFVAEVVSECGRGLPEARVSWRSDGIRTDFTTTTEPDGITSNSGRVGTQAGVHEVVASIGPLTASFFVTVEPGPPTFVLLDEPAVDPRVSLDEPVELSFRVTDQYLNSAAAGTEASFDLRIVSSPAGPHAPAFFGEEGVDLVHLETTGGVAGVALYNANIGDLLIAVDSATTLGGDPLAGVSWFRLVEDDFEGPRDWIFEGWDAWNIGSPAGGPGTGYGGSVSVLQTGPLPETDFVRGFAQYVGEMAVSALPHAERYELLFQSWYDLGFDASEICGTGAASLDGPVRELLEGGYSGPSHCFFEVEGWLGSSNGGWRATHALLDPGPDGLPVMPAFGFFFFNDGSITTPPTDGWFIDDVRLRALVFGIQLPFEAGPPRFLSLDIAQLPSAPGPPACITPGIAEVRVFDALGNPVARAGVAIDAIMVAGGVLGPVLDGSYDDGDQPGQTSATFRTDPIGRVRFELHPDGVEDPNIRVSLPLVPESTLAEIALLQPPPDSEAGFCTDGFDNDCDGSSECFDLDCGSDPACAGDDCANPIHLGSGPSYGYFTTELDRYEDDGLVATCGAGGQPDVVFELEVPEAGSYAVEVVSDGALDSGAWELANACGDSPLACGPHFDLAVVDLDLGPHFLLVEIPPGTVALGVSISPIGSPEDAQNGTCLDGRDNDFNGETDCEDTSDFDFSCRLAASECSTGIDTFPTDPGEDGLCNGSVAVFDLGAAGSYELVDPYGCACVTQSGCDLINKGGTFADFFGGPFPYVCHTEFGACGLPCSMFGTPTPDDWCTIVFGPGTFCDLDTGGCTQAPHPRAIALNGLALALGSDGAGGGHVELRAEMLDAGSYDAQTPPGELVFSVELTGTAPSDPQPSIVLTCANEGTVLVDLTVEDGDGHQQVVTTYVLVQDTADVCQGAGGEASDLNLACANGLAATLIDDGTGIGRVSIPAAAFDARSFDSDTEGLTFEVSLFGEGIFLPNVHFDCGHNSTTLVEVRAADGQGNVAFCETYVLVQDPFELCSGNPVGGEGAPAVVALNGVAVNIPPDGALTVPAATLTALAYDDTTAAAELVLTGAHAFEPLAPSLDITCDNLGTFIADVAATDLDGNTTVVQTYVVVQDNDGICF